MARIARKQGSCLAMLLLGLSCSSPRVTEWPGASLGQPQRPVARQPGGRTIGTGTEPRALGLDPAQLALLVTATDQPYLSQGHEPPDYLVQVLVSPEAAEQYRHWSVGSLMPEGVWVVARHSYRNYESALQQPPPVYTMFREATGWRYGAVTTDGRKLPLAQEVCHDCHTQARADCLFGLPAVRAAPMESN